MVLTDNIARFRTTLGENNGALRTWRRDVWRAILRIATKSTQMTPSTRGTATDKGSVEGKPRDLRCRSALKS